MTDAERWREVDRIFDAALDRPAGERTAFLDAACAGDPALRQQVERLLAADARQDGFLDRPAGEMLGLRMDAGVEGQRIGPYRLLRAIGRGGMGAVYLAVRDDEQYERLVAVKILRSGLEDTELRHRFLAERQILARLEHPNIARLYDGGSTEDGRPYLVMELIEGLPVDEYCDRHRLTVDQRLELFRKICAAVQYAHQNLLVHRDIKPANILVTAEGEPKLLDFGIAKQLEPATETDALTRTGLRVMTPSYASPEQVKGQAITTASDVYSLGVLLYELLAGCSPYQVAAGSPPYEIERAINEQQPEKPGTALLRSGTPTAEAIAASRSNRPAALRRRLAGDLDTIVLMALRKEPARRYESVARFSSDLERHLQDLPVSARPDTLRYRTRKLVRRHRVAVAAASVVFLLITALVAGLFVQGRRTAQERDKARYALSFLVDTFKQADPYHTQGEQLTAREILDQGANRISRELSGQPDVQAAVMDAIGEVNLGLGRYDAAEPLLKRSLATRRRIFGAGSLETAESLEHLAELGIQRSEHADAESHLREALAIRRRRQGAGDLAMAGTLNQLGRTLAERGVSPEVAPEIEALHREALGIARRIEGPDGLTVAETLLALADLQRASGEYARAESLFREGLAIERRALGDRDPRYWRDRRGLGDTLIEAGKFSEAETVFRQCLEVQTKLLGAEHPDVSSARGGLAAAVHLQGRYTEAETLEREVLALSRSRYGPTHWRVAEALCNLASNLAGQRRNAEAVPLYEQALEIRRRAMGEKHWQVAQILLLLAQLHRDEKRLPEALDLARQSYEVFAAGEGPDHPYTAHALLEIGKIHTVQSRFTDAEPFLRRCLEIRKKKLEPRHPDLGKAQLALARSLMGQGHQNAEVMALVREAKATFVATYGPDSKLARTTAELLEEMERGSGKAPLIAGKSK
jgi:eukaryotic-like serine/threonine-protein kinase